MRENLPTLFSPKSVAIVGASRSDEKLGSVILRNIIESNYMGDIYPINPNARRIQDLKCYSSVEELPSLPELVIIAIPAKPAIDELKKLAQIGIKNVVILSAGFKEIGDEGKELEDQIKEIAKQNNMNILGPNCLGFVNNLCPINATFGAKVDYVGNLRFISQSGAIASSIFDWSDSVTLGFNEFVTLGNKTDINECDVLEYFYKRDESAIFIDNEIGLSHVSPIGMYLESISEGERFLKVAQRMSVINPLFILKPGKTKAAAKAMQSHTGSLAGEDVVFDSVVKQAGVIRCYSLEEFFDYAKGFGWEDAPEGPNVAIVSNAGGPAVISADSVVENGLNLVEFDDPTKNKLLEALPRAASIINPVDVLGDALAQRYKDALEIVLSNEKVNSVLVLLTPQIMTQIEETAQIIGEMGRKYNKPIFCSFIGGKLVKEGEDILNRYKIPSFQYPERAIKTISAMWKWNDWTHKNVAKKEEVEITSEVNVSQIKNIVDSARNEKQLTLDNIQADGILKSLGINTPETRFAIDMDDAQDFAYKFGWPIVLKLSAPGLLHKKRLGGVITGISNEQDLQKAWLRIERAIEQLDEETKNIVKVQVQSSIQQGIEVIVGVKTDPTFGSILLFGAGGSYAELIKDVNIHRLPISHTEIVEIVLKSKIGNLLTDKYPLENLYKIISLFSKLPDINKDIKEAEINPIIVNENGVWAVDGKVIINMSESTTSINPAPPSWRDAENLSHEILASKFHFYEYESAEPLEFKPGQYVSVKVDDKNIRCYSIACNDGPNKFSLLVDTRPGGPGSQYFEKVQVGDKMTYLGPFGVFTLKEDDGAESIIFGATGSGITAIRCMIDHALKDVGMTIPIKLYFGLTHKYEIFWKDYFEQLSQQYPNFTYEYALCNPEEEWEGHTGYITELIDKDFPDATKCAGYLCGHPAMIESVTKVLVDNGCPKERIYMEKFV